MCPFAMENGPMEESRYCTVPRGELTSRIKRLKRRLQRQGIDLALIRQNADLYYFTGTVQDGHLLVPAKGDPLFCVWRAYERAKVEVAHLDLCHIKSFSEFSETVSALGLSKGIDVLGLELDSIPASLFLFYRDELWPNAHVRDLSPIIRDIRKIKSPWEVSCIQEACRQSWSALSRVPMFLEDGITELELAAKVEAEMRKRGHPGLLRMRLWNQEIGMGQIVSGNSGLMPSWTMTPVGGSGPASAFGMGAGHRKIHRGEPVSIDIGGWHCGYCCDQTRLFVLGTPSKGLEEGFRFVREVMDVLEQQLRPGVEAGVLYQMAIDMADRSGFGQIFMGRGESRVPFVGHGLGIELDEFPFISKANSMRLEPGMVIALEPKLLLEGIGVVGIEDTYLITQDGSRRLTIGPQRLQVVP